MQKLQVIYNHLEFDKKEFLNFFNNQTIICKIPNNEKNKFVSWQEFKNKKARA